VLSPMTVVNAGVITGAGGTAIAFGSADDLLVVSPGAVFNGIVDGGGGNNAVELAAAGSAGALSGLGSNFVNFGSLTVDPGATWQLSGSNNVSPAVTNSGIIIAGIGNLSLGAVGGTGLIDV